MQTRVSTGALRASLRQAGVLAFYSEDEPSDGWRNVGQIARGPAVKHEASVRIGVRAPSSIGAVDVTLGGDADVMRLARAFENASSVEMRALISSDDEVEVRCRGYLSAMNTDRLADETAVTIVRFGGEVSTHQTHGLVLWYRTLPGPANISMPAHTEYDPKARTLTIKPAEATIARGGPRRALDEEEES